MRRPTCSVPREGHFLAYTQLTTFCQIPMWGRDRGGPSGVTSLKNTSQFSSYPLWERKKKTKSNLGGKRFCFCLQLVIHGEGKSVQEVKGSLLARCLWLSKFAFFYPLRSTCSVVAPPTMGRALPYQSTIKKLPKLSGHQPIWYKRLPQLGLSQVTLDCDKVTAETNYDSLPILPLRVPHS